MTQLATKNFDLSINGIRHNVFRVTPEVETPLSAILDPAYWAHVSAKMRPGDLLQVMPEDLSYFAELIVRDAGNLYAKVAVLHHVVFNKAEEVKTPEGYEIRWRGPKCKFGVVRGNDVLKDGFLDKGEAKTWLDDLLRKAA